MKVVLPVLLALCVAGCIYDAPVATEPYREIDRMLLGNWQNTKEAEERLGITAADDRRYNVILTKGRGDQRTDLRFVAHHTEVAGRDIVNLRVYDPQTGEPGRWALVRYELPDENTLHAWAINQELVPPAPGVDETHAGGEKLTTPEAMRAHIEKLIENPELFPGEPLIYTRRPL